MQKGRFQPFLRAGAAGLAIALAVFFGLRLAGAGGEVKEAGEEAVPVPVRTKSVENRTRVVIARQELAAASIGVEPLAAVTWQEKVRGFGSMVPPQVLAEQQHAYRVAESETIRSELAVKAARIEVQRLRPLHGDDRIVSDKALEAAENTLATEEADFKAAIAQSHLQRATLDQQWGPVMGGWLVEGGAEFGHLIAGQSFLIQIALPAGGPLIEPTVAQLEPAPGVILTAKIVSRVPQTDSRFQGQDFYAVRPADPRLRFGMTVPASIFVGEPVAGAVVPDAAVVRWQGKPWIYVRVADDEFERQSIPTDRLVPGGWLVTAGLSIGTPVVIRGAQLLLSEEIKARTAAGGDGK